MLSTLGAHSLAYVAVVTFPPAHKLLLLPVYHATERFYEKKILHMMLLLKMIIRHTWIESTSSHCNGLKHTRKLLR